MLEIIQIEGKIMPRMAFKGVEPEQLDFKEGDRVISADLKFRGDETRLYFRKKHEPNTPSWKDGGYECVDEYGMRRAFFLDALILHPNQRWYDISGKKGKGRPKGSGAVKPPIDPDKPKGKRGRPSLSPEEKQKRETEISNKPKGTGKRGRPAMDPSLRKTKPYIPSGKPRGRPKKSE